MGNSTTAYDAGEKFAHYKQIPHLRDFVLVSHRERRIEVRSRVSDGGWQTSVAGRGGVAHLVSIGADLSVDVVYERSALTRLL